ncbi:hypothetical protein F0562_029150 [Nyssa sinensis]|uniref:Pentacotripeptide-repeat region of PRORP domain-containing protein n=1 Tax=Nyssa sinensis TaxID=561372 RepID=A0A5J5B484_9ASTE|nr:hypothetical protein F0562_029150 [Nyssa sinensis]
MAGAAISRSFIISNTPLSFSLYKSLSSKLRSHFYASTPPSFAIFTALPSNRSTTMATLVKRNTLSSTTQITIFGRPFSSASEEPSTIKRNTKVNFSFSESDDEDLEQTVTKKTKLPPPYDPFNKKPVIEEPEDPKNLQEVFYKIRSDGLINNAIKMFDALSKDGLTHEALELFGQIKDKGNMPDVVAHTAVIEAYANAGQGKEALKVYLRMLASGVAPNAYTYTVLIKGLANSGDAKLLGDAKKYVMEMMGKGMKPNAGTYVAVFEAFAREGKVEEGREFLVQMKAKGFVPDEKAVREVLREKRGPVFRSIMNLIFNN